MRNWAAAEAVRSLSTPAATRKPGCRSCGRAGPSPPPSPPPASPPPRPPAARDVSAPASSSRPAAGGPHLRPGPAPSRRGPCYHLLAHTTLTLAAVQDGFRTHDLTLASHAENPAWLPLYGSVCCCLVAQPVCMIQPTASGPLRVQIVPFRRFFLPIRQLEEASSFSTPGFLALICLFLYHRGRRSRPKTPERPKAEKATSPKVLVPQGDIVPGRLTEAEAVGLKALKEGEEVVGKIMDELIDRVMDATYKSYLEQQCIPYAVNRARETILQMVQMRFVPQDEGEPHLAEDPTWAEDKKPSPCLIDTWAPGAVPVRCAPYLVGLKKSQGKVSPAPSSFPPMPPPPTASLFSSAPLWTAPS
nr:uncharacterized protein LOC105105425 [Camelus dromedarius]